MAGEACLSTTLRMRNGTRASYELPENVQRQWPSGWMRKESWPHDFSPNGQYKN